MQAYLKYVVAFGLPLLAVYILTRLYIPLSRKIGLVDVPRERHQHQKTTPTAGGIPLFLGFHLGCALIFAPVWSRFGGNLDEAWWLSFLLVSAVLLVVGIVDDARGLRPVIKLLCQVCVATLAFGLGMRVGNLAGWALPAWLDLVLTVCVYVGVINAFNLIDGMDGLASGLAVISGLGLVGFFVFQRQPANTLVMLSLVGASLGFLCLNFHPARVFLGDSGSMFLGFVFASVALTSNVKTAALASLGVPLLAVGVPVLDTLLAVWRRSLRASTGKVPHIMRADLDHLHHRLASSGMSQRGVAMVLYALDAALVVTGLALVAFNSHRLSIFLLASVAGSYVIVRHVARIELWESGEAIVQGLRRPPNRALTVVGYPIADALLLALTYAAATGVVVATSLEHVSWPGRNAWLASLPVMVGVPFVLLALGQVYRRVWSRARVSEYVLLALLLTGGVVIACAVSSWGRDISRRHEVLRGLIYLGLALPVLAGIRALPRVAQDVLSWRRRGGAETDARPLTLCYGAGDAYTLLLRQSTLGMKDGKKPYRVVGLIDDDANLHGRIVHGHRVLGGGGSLARWVESLGVSQVLVTAELDVSARRYLAGVAKDSGVRILVWRTGVHELSPSELC